MFKKIKGLLNVGDGREDVTLVCLVDFCDVFDAKCIQMKILKSNSDSQCCAGRQTVT